jgi:putative transposase
MKRPRFPDRQIAFKLQQAEQGTQVVEVTRKMGISEQTFYRWKKKLGGLMPSEVRKLRQLEEEKPGFTEKIEAWPGHYNEQRPHSSL